MKYQLAMSQALGCLEGTYYLEAAGWLSLKRLGGVGVVPAIWRQGRGDALAVGCDVVQHRRRLAVDDSRIHLVVKF